MVMPGGLRQLGKNVPIGWMKNYGEKLLQKLLLQTRFTAKYLKVPGA